MRFSPENQDNGRGNYNYIKSVRVTKNIMKFLTEINLMKKLNTENELM